MSWDPTYAAGLLSAGLSQRDLLRLLDATPSEKHYENLSDEELLSISVVRVSPQETDMGDIRPVLITSEEYPDSLRSLPSPPALLYIKGTLPKGEKALAIVGTRRCSKLGSSVARSAVESIRHAQGCTVSGLAAGCDTACHVESLNYGVKTVAVLACGLDSVYPRENLKVAEKILEAGGALVSEQPPGVRVSPQRLMMRNRIIVGMSFGMVPAECPPDSRGTIAAVRMCVEYGRFLVLARPKEPYRRHPGAWLVEACASGSDELSKFFPSRRGRSFSPNGIAESPQDMNELVSIAAAFSDHVI